MNLCITKKTNKISATIFGSLLFVILFPFALFSPSRKGTISIIVLEYLEWIALLEYLNKFNCTYLYHFCSYEKDAPFIGWLNKKMGIINHKVPSSNPLKNFYTYTYCDKLSITTPFQKPEINVLSQNWHVKEYVYWPIENFQKLLPYLNRQSVQQEKQYQLAFLSSGIWLRQKQGHSPLGVGDQESELKLMDLLKNYLENHSNISFLILLHPIEKKSEEIYTEACNHYRLFFATDSIKFGLKDKNSFEYFDSIDTSIAAYSSTNLQRLFCGYKTLYAPLKFTYKIYEDSAIENIAPTNKPDLFALLNKTLMMSEKDFFECFNLEKFHFSSYRFEE